MENWEIRVALDAHWAAFDANDFELEHQIYREDAVLAVFFHTGERAQAEFALDRCQHRYYHEGIGALEGVLRHGGFSMSNFYLAQRPRGGAP